MAEFGVESPREAMHRLAEDDKVRQQPQPPPPPATAEGNWAELPRDALSVIFRKMGAVHVMEGAQWVCRPWRQLSWEPETWRVVDMTGHTFGLLHADAMLDMAREVITRSDGKMEEFHAKDFGDDRLMEYIAERTNGLLKCLHLISCHLVSDKALVELAKRSPQLERLVLSLCSFSGELIEPVGRACPQLKVFCLNRRRHYFDYYLENQESANSEALGIAMNMQELVALQLIGSALSNVGLEAILDGCLKLEFLDLSRCHNLKINENLRNKCARIRNLRLPQNIVFQQEFDEERDYSLSSRDVYDSDDDCWCSD